MAPYRVIRIDSRLIWCGNSTKFAMFKMIWGLDYSNRLLDLKWLCHAYGLLRIFQLNSLLEQSNWAIEIKNASKIFNIHYL